VSATAKCTNSDDTGLLEQRVLLLVEHCVEATAVCKGHQVVCVELLLAGWVSYAIALDGDKGNLHLGPV
jgi:hypothetical protein